MQPIKRIADFEYRGLRVKVVRDNRDEPASYAARVYIPEGADGWCASYWDRLVNGNDPAMRWHSDNVFGDIGFGLREGIGWHFTVYFYSNDAGPATTDAEAINSAKLFADSCKFRIDELSKAYVSGAVK